MNSIQTRDCSRRDAWNRFFRADGVARTLSHAALVWSTYGIVRLLFSEDVLGPPAAGLPPGFLAATSNIAAESFWVLVALSAVVFAMLSVTSGLPAALALCAALTLALLGLDHGALVAGALALSGLALRGVVFVYIEGTRADNRSVQPCSQPRDAA